MRGHRGAGLAGLATAAAFRRAGHEVAVFEQAGELRASGLAINLWSNATSLLPLAWSGGSVLRRVSRPA
jgi:salicylate hydroxylase